MHRRNVSANAPAKPLGLRARKDRRGTVLVEFAVVAPLLFMLIFGMIEMGRFMMIRQIMTNAARETCREAVMSGADAGAIEAWAQDYLNNAGIDGSVVDCTVEVGGTGLSGWSGATAAGGGSALSELNAGTPVRVTLTCNYGDLTWLPLNVIRTGMVQQATEIEGSCTMLLEAFR